eukprot:CAMPEP_0169390716 /NCGR_PEP_ID=MMETSP1017-20121227/47546_1 /TAXON_ID=342587 /ORGANISM="Karlodinium micrum, Strain CCMP2283" /LENGTH=73 /DNA_ID=CAMNT_0009493233 /DNA_START=68 /DNA_END=289 /DNA_ORIENTATION=+
MKLTFPGYMVSAGPTQGAASQLPKAIQALQDLGSTAMANVGVAAPSLQAIPVESGTRTPMAVAKIDLCPPTRE